jgi:hypothetical protein
MHLQVLLLLIIVQPKVLDYDQEQKNLEVHKCETD